MPHLPQSGEDELTADHVLDLVGQYLPAATQTRKKSDSEIGFVLYDSFAVRGSYDDYGRGNWGFSVALGEGEVVSRVLGQKLTLCGTQDEVQKALDAIDRYARLRLGTEFLAAYDATNGR